MKECPKCGFVDDIYWRPSFNRRKGEDYTHISNFAIMFPNDVDRLKREKRIHIAPYVYRLTKWNNVIRTWDRWENLSRDYEKRIAHINNPHQTKLEVFLREKGRVFLLESSGGEKKI